LDNQVHIESTIDLVLQYMGHEFIMLLLHLAIITIITILDLFGPGLELVWPEVSYPQ
jgi:hypothetical protein